ncbi:MAG: hypothetical protein OSA98_22975 [Rubripirellula sp.]|nr:hypothetical protein [Rubripirellula sp.]
MSLSVKFSPVLLVTILAFAPQTQAQSQITSSCSDEENFVVVDDAFYIVCETELMLLDMGFTNVPTQQYEEASAVLGIQEFCAGGTFLSGPSWIAALLDFGLTYEEASAVQGIQEFCAGETFLTERIDNTSMYDHLRSKTTESKVKGESGPRGTSMSSPLFR